jgi:hypothetical protein
MRRRYEVGLPDGYRARVRMEENHVSKYGFWDLLRDFNLNVISIASYSEDFKMNLFCHSYFLHTRSCDFSHVNTTLEGSTMMTQNFVYILPHQVFFTRSLLLISISQSF